MTDVPEQVSAVYRELPEEDCSTGTAPYKGWKDDAGGTRNTACAWTSCVADGDGVECDAGEQRLHPRRAT